MQKNSFTKNIINGLYKKVNKQFKSPYKTANLNWLKIKILKHLPSGKLHSHTLFGRNVFFYNGSEFLHSLKEIFVDGIYKQVLPEKPFILDCGANIGLSVIYLKQLYPQASIIAFEPDEINYELLCKNVNSFSFSDVTIRKEAVWTEDDYIDFSEDGTMGSKIEKSVSDNTKKVKAVRLKNIINKQIDFLKLDIEGAEFKVIKDMKDCLHYVKNLFLEYHGSFSQNNELIEILTIVHEAGFKYYIKEAASIYNNPFLAKDQKEKNQYDLQLNIFCFKN